MSQNFLIITNIQPVDTANVMFKALAIVIRLMWSNNNQVRLSKIPQNFRDKLFIVEGQTEREMGMMSLTVAFRNFVTSL